MAAKTNELCYKGHPLRRKDNLLYYGSMADKYIIMMQILDTKKVKDLDVATRVSVQLQLTDPDLKSRDRSGSEVPRPCGQKDRKGRAVQRHGRGGCVAGPRACE